MINIDTRKIVDILESRNYKEVKEWLKTFQNIEIVSRDASIACNKAIKDAHPKSIQISDRFHILKNLTDYCKDYIKRILNRKVEVEKLENTSQQKILKLKEKYLYAENPVQILNEAGKQHHIFIHVCTILQLIQIVELKYLNMLKQDQETISRTTLQDSMDILITEENL